MLKLADEGRNLVSTIACVVLTGGSGLRRTWRRAVNDGPSRTWRLCLCTHCSSCGRDSALALSCWTPRPAISRRSQVRWALEQVFRKVVWEESVALTQLCNKLPIGYNGTPQIHPQNCPFPFDDHHPNLIHPFLDRLLSPTQTAAGSNQPFCQNTLSGHTHTHTHTQMV